MTPHYRPILRVASGLLCIGFFLSSGVRSSAQTVFVCLGGRANRPAVIQIPGPGRGWNYSAAAPAAGDYWNRVKSTVGVDATDPAIVNAPPTARLYIHNIDTALGLPLVDSHGNPTKARLDIRMEIIRLATDKVRSEPSIHNKNVGSVPAGLMDVAWRVYLPENRLHFTVSNLPPGRRSTLYCYGTGIDPVKNRAGDGEGARFTLEPDNIPDDASGTIETTGGYNGDVYKVSPETDRVTLSPVGTTWGILESVVDGDGRIQFYTTRNSHARHYINGFQLVEGPH